jgi:hypothetical protein
VLASNDCTEISEWFTALFDCTSQAIYPTESFYLLAVTEASGI